MALPRQGCYTTVDVIVQAARDRAAKRAARSTELQQKVQALFQSPAKADSRELQRTAAANSAARLEAMIQQLGSSDFRLYFQALHQILQLGVSRSDAVKSGLGKAVRKRYEDPTTEAAALVVIRAIVKSWCPGGDVKAWMTRG